MERPGLADRQGRDVSLGSPAPPGWATGSPVFRAVCGSQDWSFEGLGDWL